MLHIFYKPLWWSMLPNDEEYSLATTVYLFSEYATKINISKASWLNWLSFCWEDPDNSFKKAKKRSENAGKHLIQSAFNTSFTGNI